MTLKRALPALTGMRETVSRALGVLLVLTLSACSSQDRATSPQEVRKLAGSSQAQKSRKTAEDHLRATVNAYAQGTPLVLGLVAVDDVCSGGKAREWFFQDGDDGYKIRCDLQVTAYYGADPHRIADVLDGVLAAGDRYLSQEHPAPYASIPFNRQNGPSPLVDYYRGTGPNPNSPSTLEPTYLFADGQSLYWDTRRSSQKKLVSEATRFDSDPPVARCLREPSSMTVEDIRKKYGMVFKLELSQVIYYEVAKNGTVVTVL